VVPHSNRPHSLCIAQPAAAGEHGSQRTNAGAA
jgi:hypothetical protein